MSDYSESVNIIDNVWGQHVLFWIWGPTPHMFTSKSVKTYLLYIYYFAVTSAVNIALSLLQSIFVLPVNIALCDNIWAVGLIIRK